MLINIIFRAIEIVDLPMKHGDFLQFFVCLPGRVSLCIPRFAQSQGDPGDAAGWRWDQQRRGPKKKGQVTGQVTFMVSWVSWLMEKLVIFSVPLAKLWGPPCHSTAHQTLSRARTFSDTLEMSLTSVVLLKLGEHVLIHVATYKLDQINILNSMFSMLAQKYMQNSLLQNMN